ncbi:hypothetical protein [Kitasatospora sp. McL0602]|uniref:hypothetical protein n=1 Tax=Kitasatospora sp. McL0602 TaxID=3439530 RepID=UPI003F8BF08A
MNIFKKKTAPTEELDTTGLVAADYKLPVWFFGFEGVLAGAFDIIKAVHWAWPALIVLLVVNIAVSLTMMRRRLRLAKALWRGKETRKIVIGLVALRVGSHFVMAALGLGIDTPLGHGLFAVVMAGVTIGLLAYTQHIALRSLGLAGTAAAAPVAA